QYSAAEPVIDVANVARRGADHRFGSRNIAAQFQWQWKYYRDWNLERPSHVHQQWYPCSGRDCDFCQRSGHSGNNHGRWGYPSGELLRDVNGTWYTDKRAAVSGTTKALQDQRHGDVERQGLGPGHSHRA